MSQQPPATPPQKKRVKKRAPPPTGPLMVRVTAFDFMFNSLEGQPMPLALWRGHPLLIVNTASRCGFTPQYKELQALWERYRERGLVVIGVPSGDFGKQEFGKAAKIREFCTKRYDVTFPLTEKTKVFGFGKHPFYKWAGRWAGFIGSPKWNFHKYLITPEGLMYDWFMPFTSPLSPQVVNAVEFLLSPQRPVA